MKYPGLWFDDGDIILSATTAYRESWLFLVHKHTLSTHSSVFSAIFNHPSGVHQDDVDGIQAIDDVQLLQVNDPAVDLAVLLRCLYCPGDMPFKIEKPSIDVDLAGLLRICKKYDIADLAASVVQQLKFEWPISLSVWEEHETRVRTLGIALAAAPRGRIGGKYLDDHFPEPASIIRLAREFDIPELLPAAFYALSLISPTASYDTFHSPAGRVHPEYAAKLAVLTRSARWPLLASEDLLCLAKGRDQLRSPIALTKIFEKRVSQRGCSLGCTVLLVALRRLAEDTHDLLGALTYLRLYISKPECAPKMKICPSCVEATCKTVAVLRMRIWGSLPEWFGVPGVKCTP
ncbi:hypothetical protein DFH09DRAFT_1481764 [Mycena vulgaris]|nr:hypothetical protein DFH09DRAFT_1481764 [Mycena vulgaris]